MKNWKNFIIFIVGCVFILNAIGSTGYLFYDGHILFGVTNIIISILFAVLAYLCHKFDGLDG